MQLGIKKKERKKAWKEINSTLIYSGREEFHSTRWRIYMPLITNDMLETAKGDKSTAFLCKFYGNSIILEREFI